MFVDGLSTVAFEFSNIGMRQWPGEGNISTDPLFTDPAGLDYTLGEGSPSIGTGREGSEMGALGSRGGGPQPEDTVFLRGDANEDGEVDVSDAITELAYLLRGRDAAESIDVMDPNDDAEDGQSGKDLLLANRVDRHRDDFTAEAATEGVLQDG